MNPELPKNPREELELRVTALLLGELSADEAAAVRTAIANDSELTRLHDDLKQTIHLVREATTSASLPTAEQSAQLQLSEERHKKLLTHFAIPPLKSSDRKPTPLFRLGLVEWAAVLAIIAVIAAIAVTPLGVMQRGKGQVSTTTEQLVARMAADAGLERARAEVLAQTLSVPDPGSNTMYSMDVVGYHNVPTTKLPSVSLGAAAGVPTASQLSTSGRLPMARGSLEQAGTPLATPPPEASVAALAPTTPVLPVRQRSQVVLPSLADADGDGKANYAFIATSNTFAFRLPTDEKSKAQEGEKALLAKSDASRIVPSQLNGAPKSDTLRESNFEPIGRATVTNAYSAGNFSGGINGAVGSQGGGGTGGGGAGGFRFFTSANSYAAAGEVSTPPPGENAVALDSFSVVPKTPAIDPSTGLPVPMESGFVEYPSAGVEGGIHITRRIELPGVVASTTSPVSNPGSLALEETRRPAEVAGIKLNAEGTLQGNAAKVPVLGDLPQAGKFFRSESKTSGNESSGQRPYDKATQYRLLSQLGTDSGLETSREKRGGNVLTVTGANSFGLGTTVAGGNVALTPLQPEQKTILSDDQLISGGVVGTTLAYPAAPAKSVENLGAIILPAAPEENGRAAAAEKSRLATMPSRTLRPPADEEAGKRETLERKIASVQKEVEEQRQKLAVSDADAAGKRPTQLIEGESLRRTTALRIESEAQSVALQASLDKLKTLGKEELGKVLAKTGLDPSLNESLSQLGDAEKELAALKKDHGPGDPEYLRVKTQADGLNRKVNERIDGVMTGLELDATMAKAQSEALKKSIEEAERLDIEKAQKSRPYFEKKRELEELVNLGRILNMKLAAEKIDLSLPKATMVEITDRAQPANEKTGFWRSLGAPVGGAFASTARVKIGRDASDIEGMAGSRTHAAYDPFFIQTEFEAVQSDAVLGKVVDTLKLDEAWAANRGGEKLNKTEAIRLLKGKLDLQPVRNTSLVEIRAKSDKPDEAAEIANAVAEAYKDQRQQERTKLASGGIQALEERYLEQRDKTRHVQAELETLREQLKISEADVGGIASPKEEDRSVRRSPTNTPIPQPEIQTSENNFSTFSLNVSDVSFKLAAASLEKGQMPDAASVRSEEFINAFDYRDPEPPAGAPMAFAWERARYPFAHNRDLLRFSLKTAAAGRQAGRPLNIVLLLDNSGSMERADRVSIIREALRVLALQLQPEDKLSVITFARTPRLVADGISGDKAGAVTEQVGGLTPQGGTNLEDAMNLAYQTAARHYLANGINRVVLLTDGAANLGDVEPESLKQKVETHRKQGIALDCFGIGWEGFNDDLLEVLSRNGDGRYGFINSPAEAATEFAGQLAGALKVAASDVKVQVEFNPKRVTAYRQLGYAKHQLTKEQFRDNAVDAAEIAAQEAGNALYTVAVNPAGEGPLGTVRVRYKIPGTMDYREQAWDVPYTGNAVSLEQSSPAMRLGATASAFSEWLVASPFAGEVMPDRLLGYLSGVPEVYGADSRPKKLEWMIRQAKSLQGK